MSSPDPLPAGEREVIAAVPSRQKKLRSIIISVAAVAGSVAIAVGVVYFRDEMTALGGLGYPGIFLISLLASATIFIPAPGWLAVIALGSVLNPFLVGILAGAGSALGESTGYLAGLGGKAVVEDNPTYKRLDRWIDRYGPFAILVMAALPNPVFDAGGLIAGVSGMPPWQFLLATWIGKSIRFTLLAQGGNLLG